MRNKMKKLSIFLLVIFLSMTSVFISNNDKITAQNNVQGVELSKETKITPGVQLSYYLNISTLGLSQAQLDGSYSLIYLDKDIFVEPQLTNIAAESYVASREILSDNDNYIIKITYNNQLKPGSTKGLPFSATAKNHVLYVGDQVTITNKFFASNGGEVISKDNVFDVQLYTWKQLQGPWDSEVNLEFNQVNDNRTKAKISSITFDRFYLNAWDPEKNKRPTFMYEGGAPHPYSGRDARRVKITVDLSNLDFGFTFNQNYDSSNQEFTYDDTTKTLTAWSPPVNYEDKQGYIQNYFTLRINDLQNGPELGKKYEITYKAEIEERNGQLTEVGIRKMSLTYKYTPLVISASPITLDELAMKKEVNRGSDTISTTNTPYMEEKYYYNLTYSTPQSKYPAGKKFKIKELYDIPNYEMVLHSFAFNVDGNNLTEVEKAALQNNQLIGTNLDDSEEVIAEDVKLNSSYSSYIRNENNDLPNKKAYKKIRLVFEDGVELTTKTDGGKFDFRLGLSTNINPTQETREKIQKYFKEEYDKVKLTNPSFRPKYQIKNTFGIKNNDENRDEFILIDIIDIDTTSYAGLDGGGLRTDPGFSIHNITRSNKLKYHLVLRSRSKKREVQPFQDLKYVLLLPEGIEIENIAPDPTQASVTAVFDKVIKNYKDTGQNAYFYNIDGFTAPAETDQIRFPSNIMSMIANLKVTASTKPGYNTITGFYTWSNTDINEIFVSSSHSDSLDVNENGNKTERIVKETSSFNLVESKEFSIIKHSKFSSEADTKYSLNTNIDTENPTDYRITISNNTNSSRGNIDIIDILPRIGDKEIVNDTSGIYLDRGSQFKMKLAGPITPVAGYKYLYSTTTPYERLEDNINLANWSDAAGIADFGQVTMFRIQLDTWRTMDPFSKKEFKFKALPTELPPAFVGKEAINSIATILDGDITAAVESVASTVMLTKYKLSGTVYTDRNDNSTLDITEVRSANRNIKIYHTPQGGIEQLVTTLQTKPDGSYEFNPHLFGLGRGNYRVEVEKNADETFAATVNSVKPNINNDVDTNGSKSIVLNPEHVDVVVNAAFTHPKTEVRHEFEVDATSESNTLLAGINARLTGKNYSSLIGETIIPKGDIDLSDEVINDGVNSGTWSFVSWNPITKVATQAIEVFKGTWKFTKKRGSVEFEFASDSAKPLPTEVTDLKPNALVNQVYGTTITPTPATFNDVVIQDGVNSGTWKFVSWNKAEDVVDGNEDQFTGTWTFIKKEIVSISNLKNSVDSSDITLNYVMLLLVSIGLFIAVRKENK